MEGQGACRRAGQQGRQEVGQAACRRAGQQGRQEVGQGACHRGGQQWRQEGPRGRASVATLAEEVRQVVRQGACHKGSQDVRQAVGLGARRGQQGLQGVGQGPYHRADQEGPRGRASVAILAEVEGASGAGR